MRTPLRSKLSYAFENVLSKGTVAIIGLLGLFSAAVIGLAGLLVVATGVGPSSGEDMSLIEAVWQSFLHAIDAGTVAGDSGWGLRAVMLLVTLCGIFIVSILIGAITSGLEQRLTDLRKGRSRVLETNHTLILGWSSKIHSILSELIIANENQKNPRIVILAPRDKVEMEDEISARLPSTKNTKIICRTGSPLDLNDLDVVSPNDARAIIVLSPENDHADTDVIKSILALTNNPSRNGKKFHIVAEIQQEENMEAAALVGKDEATLVLSSDLIAKVTAQTCRQSGLSMVYTELLDFDGAEIYFSSEATLIGKTYREALSGYQTSTVMGIFQKDGTVLVNPPMGRLIEAGDQLILIAMDDDTIHFTGSRAKGAASPIGDQSPENPSRERTLILGWNEKSQNIIRELDNYVAQGSEVHIVAESGLDASSLSAMQMDLRNLRLSFEEGNITDRKTLERIGVGTFDHIIILCYPHLEVQQADAKTLITLLHLRNIAEKMKKEFSIVSEMLDIKNRDLAQVAKADDFIVSDKLVSLMLAQLSENRELKKVFDQLFTSEGSEIYLKPIGKYLKVGEETDFYTLLESAAERGETAIGYRKHVLTNDPKSMYGVVVNPDKAERVTFEEEDRVIVLAEN